VTDGRDARGPNLVLVTVDCMRRDRVSAYGYPRRTTPFLDSLLDRSLHCLSAHSPSSWTCPSVISLISGLYPHRHGGGLVPGDPKNLSRQNLPTELPQDVAVLPDLLAPHGYTSAAIGAVWNAHLSIPGRFSHMSMLERPAARLVRRAVKWIGRQDGPFFLWLHLGDAHEPLDVPRDLWNIFGPVPRTSGVRRWEYTTSGSAVDSEGFRHYREARVRLYDAAIRSADASIGELWSALGALGIRDRTVFAVTADHGEEFWEHREEERGSFTDPRDIYGTGHGHNLFQVHLLVPLVLTGPGIPAGAVSGNVSLVDVVPTALQAMGVEAPSVDGWSLLDADRDWAGRPVLAEGVAYGHDKVSVVRGDLKLLASPGDGYERMWRLGADRRESEPLHETNLAADLRQHIPGESRFGEQVEATEEIEAHLRDLGYID
jgi:arylsulfatase A-like enzyme